MPSHTYDPLVRHVGSLMSKKPQQLLAEYKDLVSEFDDIKKKKFKIYMMNAFKFEGTSA